MESLEKFLTKRAVNDPCEVVVSRLISQLPGQCDSKSSEWRQQSSEKCYDLRPVDSESAI